MATRPLSFTTRIRHEVTAFQDPVDEEVRNVTGVESRKLAASHTSEAPRQVDWLHWITLAHSHTGWFIFYTSCLSTLQKGLFEYQWHQVKREIQNVRRWAGSHL